MFILKYNKLIAVKIVFCHWRRKTMLEHKILGRDFTDNVVLKISYVVIFTKMTPYVPYGKKIISNQFQMLILTIRFLLQTTTDHCIEMQL